MTGFDLSYWQVGLAAALILVNAVVSLTLRLGLELRLGVAALRTVAQLSLLGLVLNWVFTHPYWYVLTPIAVFMVVVAAYSAQGRTRRRYTGMWLNIVVSLWVSSWLITGVTLLVVLQVQPWYEPRYLISILGMILGNTLNGISLGLDRFHEELATHRQRVDTALALGATRWEAAQPILQNAVRTGMIPIINSMMIVGLVSLPGMMTGQLLAGADVWQAVKYQIVIMFVIASGTALGTVAVVLSSFRKLFNARHQFLFDQLHQR